MEFKQSKIGSEDILMKLLKVYWSRKFFILAFVIVGAILGFCYSKFLVTPTYQASAMLFVNNRNASYDSSNEISSKDISTSQNLINTYSAIIKSQKVLSLVKEKMQTEMSEGTLSGMISIYSVDSTEVFKVTVTSTDPQLTADLANVVADVSTDYLAKMVSGPTAQVIDYATVPTSNSGPDHKKNTAVGAIIGAIIALIIITIISLTDTSIKDEMEIQENWKDIPIIGVIPDFDDGRNDKKYGYEYYKYGEGK